MITSEDIFSCELEILEERCFPYQDLYLLESENSPSLSSALKAFFKGIKEMISKAIGMMSGKITKTVKSKEAGEALAALKAQCHSARAQGKQSITCYDVVKYQKELKETMDKLDKVTKSYLKKYDKSGRNVKQTDKMIDEVNALIEKSNKVLNEIKSKKVEVPIESLLSWIDKELRAGHVAVFDFAEDYLKRLDEYAKLAEEFDKKAEDFAKENGVIRRPKGITQSIRNTANYVKRNIDWIGAFSIAIIGYGSLRQFGNASKKAEYEHIANTGGFTGDDSLFGNSEALYRKAELQHEANMHKTKKGKHMAAGEVVVSAAIPAASMAGIQNLSKAKAERRNSV